MEGITAACVICDAPVDMSSPITVTITEVGGTESSQEMTEANARMLVVSAGLPPPLVMCDNHPEYEEPTL